MSGEDEDAPTPGADQSSGSYRPPTITRLGTVADLTRKEVGAADGTTFLGIEIGSV